MSADDPKTLLEHPARVEGKQGRANPRPPEVVLKFASGILRSLGVTERKHLYAALQDKGNPAFHAAWLQRHAVKVLDILAKASPEAHASLREVWTQAFHAGARHESIRADHHYLRTVQGQRRRTKKLAEARQKSADKRRKFTAAKLGAGKNAGLTKKGLAKCLGVSRQAIDKRERRNKL
jgi:DNA-binding XRE family transcriptional regulator